MSYRLAAIPCAGHILFYGLSMTRGLKWLTGLVATGAGLVGFGFIVFASIVMREPASETEKADAIVVLTGGEARIGEAARLLRQGRAERLLITGVNPMTGSRDIANLSGLTPDELACCVDLGYEALNTKGNAEETAGWIRARGYDSLIVVTASYHMPRSLLELSRELPNVKLIAHRVMPQSLQGRGWWSHPGTARILLSEYVKLFPAAARLAATRVFSGWNDSTVAESKPHTPAKI